MASPIIESTAVTNTLSTSSLSVTMPSGIVAGDVLVCVASIDFGNSRTFSIDTGASGLNWTLGTPANEYGIRSYVVYKTAEGSDALTLTPSSTEGAAAVCFRISGSDGTVDWTAAVADSTTAPDSPSHTPGGGSADYLWLSVATWEANATVSAYPGGSYTDGSASIAGGSGGVSNAYAYRQFTGASDNPGAFTISTGYDWVAFTIAIAPSAGGGSSIPVIMHHRADFKTMLTR